MKEKFLYFFLSVIVVMLVLVLQTNKIEPFNSFSLRFNDVNFELQTKTPNKDIVFVAVDEPSVNKFGRWPWNRKILARGIDKLNQADIVLMDMIFSELTSQVADEALAKSISNLKVSVCGFFLRHASTQIMDEDALDLLSDSSLDLLHSQIGEYQTPHFVGASFAELNSLDILQSCTMSGSFSTLAQSDKLFRSYPIAVYYNETLFPSLGVQALRLKFNKDLKRLDAHSVLIDKRKIIINDRGFVRLNYYEREQYNIVSFLDVIEQKIKPSYFKDKIVILGITDVGSGDVVSTPVGFLFGALLHYTFLSNILEHHLIVEPKNISEILVVLLSLIPCLLIFFIRNIRNRVLLTVAIYLLIYMSVRTLFIYKMIYIDLFFPLLAMSLSAITIEVLAFSNHERKSRFLKDAFSSYLSEELLTELTNNPKALILGGEKKELSILFSDIRGFTTISESMDAEELVYLLNRYFTPMTNTVLKHKGMLDKYIGDALMAFYNAPVDVKNHADKVCLSALEMIEHLHVLNKELQKEGKDSLDIGIGINTAEVVVGNMGSDSRFNYTIMGDGVNLAARLESITKLYGVRILITEFTVAQLSESFVYRKIEPVIVKGKNEAILLYELMHEDALELKMSYDKALSLYIDKNSKEAETLFAKLVDVYDDNLSAYFLKNIKEGLFWGVHTMKEK